MKVVHHKKETQWSSPETFTIKFDRFSRLDATPGVRTYSPAFTCNGVTWRLALYPGGTHAAIHSSRTTLGIFLCMVSSCYQHDCIAKGTLVIPALNTKWTQKQYNYSCSSSRAGWSKCAYRDTILKDGCHNDTITFELTIEMLMDVAKYEPWSPALSFSPAKLNAFRRNKFTDITFEVTDDDDASTPHIMEANAALFLMEVPAMESFIMNDTESSDDVDESNDGGGGGGGKRHHVVKTIPVPNTNPKYFRSMLEFIYSESTEFLDGAKSSDYLQGMLNVANKFGCWRLKLTIEAKIINEHLEDCTAISLLFFANAHNCYMLNEACLNMIGRDVTHALQGEDATKLCENAGLMKEIQRYVSGKYWQDDDVNDEYTKLTIAELYEELDAQKRTEMGSDLSRKELLELVRM